jgi:hypothetical protein
MTKIDVETACKIFQDCVDCYSNRIATAEIGSPIRTGYVDWAGHGLPPAGCIRGVVNSGEFDLKLSTVFAQNEVLWAFLKEAGISPAEGRKFFNGLGIGKLAQRFNGLEYV